MNKKGFLDVVEISSTSTTNGRVFLFLPPLLTQNITSMMLHCI